MKKICGLLTLFFYSDLLKASTINGGHSSNLFSEYGHSIPCLDIEIIDLSTGFDSFFFIPLAASLNGSSNIAFVLILIGLTISILFGISAFSRLQRIRDMEACRTKISRNLHDEVGGSLTYISMQSEILLSEIPKEHRMALESILQNSRLAMSNMRDVIWSMDTQYHQMENLYDKFAEMIQKTSEITPIRFQLNFDQEIRDMYLTQKQKQEIFYIIKEAIQNVVKHANGDQALVHVKYLNKQQLEFVVSNNGTAQPMRNTTGSGIHNMLMRANSLGAKLRIVEEDGFKICLTIDTRKKIFYQIRKWLTKI